MIGHLQRGSQVPHSYCTMRLTSIPIYSDWLGGSTNEARMCASLWWPRVKKSSFDLDKQLHTLNFYIKL